MRFNKSKSIPGISILFGLALFLNPGNVMAQTFDTTAGSGKTALIPRGRTYDVAEPNVLEEATILPADRPALAPDPAFLSSLPDALQSVERHMNELGYTLKNPKDVWQAHAWDTPVAGKGTYKVRSTDPRNWDWSREAGSKNTLWGKISLALSHSGDRNTARLSGSARADAAILGRERNVVTATADLTARRSGQQTANLRLDLLGKTVWSPSKTSNADIQYTDGWSFRGRIWTVGFNIGIAGFGVGAEVYQYGEVGWNLTANCFTGSRPTAQLVTGPYVSTGLAGSASLDAGVAYARFEGEVGLTALVLGGAHTIINGSNLEGARWVDLKAQFLQGSAKIKVKARNPFGGDPTLGTWTLWNEPNGLFSLNQRIEERSFTTRL